MVQLSDDISTVSYLSKTSNKSRTSDISPYKLRISADISKQVFGKYHDFFIGMPPTGNLECFPKSRRPSPAIIPGIDSVMNLVSRSAPLYDRPKTVSSNSSRSPHPVVPPCIRSVRTKNSKRLASSTTLPIIKTRIFNTSISKTFSSRPVPILSAEKPSKRFKLQCKTASSVERVNKSNPGIVRQKSLPVKSSDSNTIDDVMIKRVIKYCRNIDSAESSFGSGGMEKKKKKNNKNKIYLSEGLNKVKKGALGVPPCSPTPEYLETVQYIQCLADMKGKRKLGSKLSEIVKFQEEQRKKQEFEQQKLKIEEDKKQQLLLRVSQRNEIYALNKVMKELEQRRFSEYCKSRLNGKQSSKCDIGGV